MRKFATGMKSRRAGRTLALFAGVALSALASAPAAARGKQLTLVLGGVGSGQRAGRARQGFHQARPASR